MSEISVKIDSYDTETGAYLITHYGEFSGEKSLSDVIGAIRSEEKKPSDMLVQVYGNDIKSFSMIDKAPVASMPEKEGPPVRPIISDKAVDIALAIVKAIDKSAQRVAKRKEKEEEAYREQERFEAIFEVAETRKEIRALKDKLRGYKIALVVAGVLFIGLAKLFYNIIG